MASSLPNERLQEEASLLTDENDKEPKKRSLSFNYTFHGETWHGGQSYKKSLAEGPSNASRNWMGGQTTANQVNISLMCSIRVVVMRKFDPTLKISAGGVGMKETYKPHKNELTWGSGCADSTMGSAFNPAGPAIDHFRENSANVEIDALLSCHFWTGLDSK
jgi:hypothetical protein